jgi:hypothetical protein
MLAYVVSEGRLFALKPSDWSMLLGGVTLCGLMTLLLGSAHGSFWTAHLLAHVESRQNLRSLRARPDNEFELGFEAIDTLELL